MSDRESFLVGAAMADITPGRSLVNYNGDPLVREDGDSDLLCHALYLACGPIETVIAACDATFIDRTLVLRIRDECERRVGIPASNVWVTATHTHSSPATAVSFLAGALPDPLYLDSFIERVLTSIVEARQHAQPAVAVAGKTSAPGFELNRRTIRPDGGIMFQQWNDDWPAEGPVDPDVGFLGFETQNGQPIAIVVNYAVHNNYCNTGVYHRDVFGRCGDALREALPGLRATLIVPGASGNIMGGDPDSLQQRGGDDHARHVARKCADLVSRAYEQADRRSVSELDLTARVLDLPDRPVSESTFCHDGCRGSNEEALRSARERYDPEQKALRERGATTCAVEISALSFGDVAIVTSPAELFVEYGLEIKRHSPFATTLVAELTNGYCGYVPTAAAFQHGGYETHRTMYTSRLGVDAGDRIVKASLELLRELRG